MNGKLNKRTRKAITSAVDRLSDKYGFAEVRQVINSYFRVARETTKLAKEVAAKEKELASLKKKLGA